MGMSMEIGACEVPGDWRSLCIKTFANTSFNSGFLDGEAFEFFSEEEEVSPEARHLFFLTGLIPFEVQEKFDQWCQSYLVKTFDVLKTLIQESCNMYEFETKFGVMLVSCGSTWGDAVPGVTELRALSQSGVFDHL